MGVHDSVITPRRLSPRYRAISKSPPCLAGEPLHGLAAGEAEDGEPRVARRLQGDFELQILEARFDFLVEAIQEQAVVGAARRGPPRSGLRARHPALEQDIAAGQPERAGDRERAIGRAVARVDHGDRGEATAVTRLEPGRVEADALDRGRIDEAAHEVAEALRPVNLDAVDDDQIVLGAAAPHRDLAVLVVDAGRTRQHLEHLKDVLESAGGVAHRRGLERIGRRWIRRSRAVDR